MSRPKDNEEKLQQVLNAWSSIASAKSFGGMTLDDYRAVVNAAMTARSEAEDIEAHLTAALTKRDNADSVGLAKVELIVNGVRADPTEGPDSALYEAMGYTRKSDRKSGLTRKKQTPPSTP
jgi:hypothetical protein